MKLKKHVPTALLVGTLALAGAACEVEGGVEDPGVTDPLDDTTGDDLGDDGLGDDTGDDTGETTP